jgi:hypothetical protein
MYELPKEPQKIRQRLRRYERKLEAEKREYGDIRDGAGKRYLLGPLYLIIGELDGALESFRWFEEECPDDSGEPGQYLCWALALYQSGNHEAAALKLRQTMLMNLYVIPLLLGERIERIDMWHGSNWDEPTYLQYIPPEYFALWNGKARKWAADLYRSEEFQALAARYIEIHKLLLTTPPGPERSRLVDEALALWS